MPKPLESLTNAKLAAEIERRSAKLQAAIHAVYALASKGGDRFSEITDRLGHDHRAVKAMESAARALEAAESVAASRLGPDLPRVVYASYLRD